MPHRARRADVAKPPLFLEGRDVRRRALVRKQAFLHAREKHDGNSRPLAECRVIICTQSAYRIRLAFADSSTACARRTRAAAYPSPLPARSRVPRSRARGDSRPSLAALALLLLVVLDEAARLHDVIDLIVQLEPAHLGGQFSMICRNAASACAARCESPR